MLDNTEGKMTEGLHYMIRLDASPSVSSESLVFWLQRQDTLIKCYILSKEGNGGTIKFHYHLYIEFNEITKKDTLDKRVKRAFDNRGTTASIALCREVEKSRTYTVKDGLIIKYKGFTPAIIEDYKVRSYQKKGKKPDMFNVLLVKCKKSGINTEPEIMALVFDAYRGNRMYFSHMKAVVKGLNAMFNPKDEYEHFEQYCM